MTYSIKVKTRGGEDGTWAMNQPRDQAILKAQQLRSSRKYKRVWIALEQPPTDSDTVQRS